MSSISMYLACAVGALTAAIAIWVFQVERRSGETIDSKPRAPSAIIAAAGRDQQSSVRVEDCYPVQPGQYRSLIRMIEGVRSEVDLVGSYEEIDHERLLRIETKLDVRDDIVIQTEYLRVTSDGMFRCRVDGTPMEPPLLILCSPVTDRAWVSEHRTGDRTIKVHTSVKVGDTVRTSATTEDPWVNVTSWYAPGHGLAAQETWVPAEGEVGPDPSITHLRMRVEAR
jgi:hypothetical protein